MFATYVRPEGCTGPPRATSLVLENSVSEHYKQFCEHLDFIGLSAYGRVSLRTYDLASI